MTPLEHAAVEYVAAKEWYDAQRHFVRSKDLVYVAAWRRLKRAAAFGQVVEDTKTDST